LSGIHLALLARSQLVKKFGLEKILEPMISDLKTLESDGICLEHSGDKVQLRGTVASISADNLGSHQVGGVRQSFSSGKMCRFCMIDYKDLSLSVDEDSCVLRTASVHASHISGVCADSTLCRTYGVSTVSPFDQLSYFSVTESLPPDAMHHILEGLCVINVRIVLLHLIQSKQMTVKCFNDKLDLFEFAACDRLAKPPHLPVDFVSKHGLVCSASQCWCLFRNLPFLLHDVVDVDADYWTLHLLRREICRIILSPVVKKEWLVDLQQHIVEHHTLLARMDSSLFSPKLHFLIHYPRMISVFGPLKHLWCMRFEACHQYFKKIAKISNNYRNIALTLTERYQFEKCWAFSGKNALAADTKVTGKQCTVTVSALPRALQSELQATFALQSNHQVLSVKNVQLGCVSLLQNGMYVVDALGHDAVPVFLQVSHILQHEGTWIVCGFMNVVDKHSCVLDAFKLRSLTDYTVISPADIKSYGPVACVTLANTSYVSMPYIVPN